MSASISVALCTHNGVRFIAEQVRSICMQTRPPAEIVLSDDDSSDDTVALVRATVAQCEVDRPGLKIALRVFENRPALRVTRNFEQACMACTGDLIALSDQDDTWPADRLESLAAEFERRPDLLLLHTDATLIGAGAEPLGDTLFHALEVEPWEMDRIHRGDAFSVFLRRNLVTGATTVFRRSLLSRAAPFPVEWLHDEWLAIVAAAVGRVDVLEQPLIGYRQHGGNQIGAERDTFARKVQKALASRGNTHVMRARKAELLLERLESIGQPTVPVERVRQVQGKLVHQRFRAALPASRLARCVPVLREAMTGRYNQFGRGFRGVVRDLFESV
ncbi:glycosyltransferase [Variovorax dokdonensis]|uniref:Glycosyltransferase n=1 Tax=Variovorax dokdonensis TaxID=344883 RepID=A0ABT7NB89_9BURK|nr:glycosyltransferase [Variovorax dokdonensis]